jgi:exosortase D (VPLPA-CTERM-specific)
MLVKTDRAVGTISARKSAIYGSLLFGTCLLLTVVTLSGPLLELVRRWDSQEEYRHGYIIPLIAIWLLWTRRQALVASVGRPSWMGPALIVLAALMHIVGKLSALFVLSQLSFIVILIGLVLGFGGYSLLRAAFVPIIFLIFAIPLPYFLDAALSFRLQIISSQLGVFFIRLLHIPVYLEGNVIDLGNYRLQVVEACSGLRYLYPLMSLGFLAAYLFQAPLWQRALIFASTIPITILMNSLRIGLVGILSDFWGPQDADGLLHMFEGWIIFVGCTLLLIAEMALLARFALGRPFFDVFYPPSGRAIASPGNTPRLSNFAPLAACFLIVCTAGLATYLVTTRHEIFPERKLFAAFPTKMGEWRGKPSSLNAQTEYGLGLTDYILSDYARGDGRSVNLYVAYYASQRTGVSPHSPSVCIPGNGWSITDLERTYFRSDDSRIALPLNRAIIARQSERLLAYYWYDERGMKIANEYWSKLYLLKDAIFKNRTDGALIRLMTPIYAGESERDAEKRMRDFVETVVPQLSAFLPSDASPQIRPAMISNPANHS